MRDRIGNGIKPGDLLIWLQNHMICEVLEATDDDTPEIQMPGHPPHEPMGLVVVKLKLPVGRQGIRSGQEVMLSDFIRVVSPKSEQVVDRLASRVPAIIPPRGGKPS